MGGGRCHPSVSDYHITAVLGLAGPLSCLTDRALEEGLKGGRCHPSVSEYHITSYLCTMQMSGLYVCPPKTFLKSNLLIIFATIMIGLWIERELLDRRDGGYACYFKSQSKDAKEYNLREKLNAVIDCFCNLNLRAQDKKFELSKKIG